MICVFLFFFTKPFHVVFKSVMEAEDQAPVVFHDRQQLIARIEKNGSTHNSCAADELVDLMSNEDDEKGQSLVRASPQEPTRLLRPLLSRTEAAMPEI